MSRDSNATLTNVASVLATRAEGVAINPNREAATMFVNPLYGDKPRVFAYPVDLVYHPTVSGSVNYVDATFRVVFTHPLGPESDVGFVQASNIEDLDAFANDLATTPALMYTPSGGTATRIGNTAGTSYELSHGRETSYMWSAIMVQVQYDRN